MFLDIQRDFKDADYMRRYERLPVDLIFHGETGCFTMLMFEPNQSLMHNYSGMGLGGGTGAGADPFITNKQVVFLGDSTFFHSGLLAISDSLKSGQDITYVILDNKTTAMTGHQPTPGTDLNLMGERTYAQNISAIVQAMAGQGVPVTTLDPGDRDTYRQLLERTVLQDGVKVVIADKECGLVVERRERQEKQAQVRQHGFLASETFIQITPEACEFCLVCTQTTGCPGLTFTQTLDGPKLQTDLSLCVADGACAKIQACPAFEEVTVTRKNADVGIPDRGSEPIIPHSDFRVPTSDPYYIHIAGVGGQGAGLLSAVLVQAAHTEGWRVLFTDKKGLAVRNGAVYGQLMLTRDGGVRAPGIPAGHADLVLGLDRLETLRSVDPQGIQRVASAERTSFIVNDAVQLTVRMLTGRDHPEQVPALESLRPWARAARHLVRGSVADRAERIWRQTLCQSPASRRRGPARHNSRKYREPRTSHSPVRAARRTGDESPRVSQRPSLGGNSCIRNKNYRRLFRFSRGVGISAPLCRRNRVCLGPSRSAAKRHGMASARLNRL